MIAADLVAAAEHAFAAASRSADASVLDGRLCGRDVRFEFAGTFFADQLSRALALEPATEGHDHDVSNVKPALTMRAWDAASTGVRLDAGSWEGMMLNPSSVVDELSDERYQVSLEVHGALVSILDREAGTAYHYVPDPNLLPAWETTHPARVLLAAWARAQGLVTCHAAAVADTDGGLLLCGGSGAGKSTTTLAALAAGMRSVGDDYVLVEPGRPPVVHALYRSTLLEVGHYEQNRALMPDVDLIADQVDRHKAVMFAGGPGRPTIEGSFAIVALVALHVEPGSEPAFARSTGAVALRALAPSTLAQLGMVDGAGLARLADLCRSVPAYTLRLGDDPSPVPQLLHQLLEDARQGDAVAARG